MYLNIKYVFNLCMNMNENDNSVPNHQMIYYIDIYIYHIVHLLSHSYFYTIY